MQKEIEVFSPAKINKLASEAWLGLGDTSKLDIINPMFALDMEDKTDPGKKQIRFMKNTEYLAYAAKTLLNVHLLPLQAAILQEMWYRPFPMYIASRGFGKMIRPDELVRIQGGWKKIKDIKIGDKIYGGNGRLCNVTNKTALQHNLKMYRITLRDGRTIDCCEDHQWKVWDKNKNRDKKNNWSVLKTKELVQNYFWNRTGEKSNGIEYRYALPINKPLVDESTTELLLHPYIVGVLLGDGSLTTNTISFTTQDDEIINNVLKLLPQEYQLTIRPKENHKVCTFVRNPIINKIDFVPFHRLCQEIGIWKLDSHTKYIPEEYKFASYKQKLELVKGLMDTDGYSNGQSVIEYYTVSSSLATDFLDVARSLGLHCKDSIKQAWFNKKRYTDCHRISIYTDKPIFSLSRKLQYLKHTISKQGRSKYNKVFITKIEPIENADGYCISVDSPDNTYITKDYIVTHNSYLLAVLCMLKLALTPQALGGGPGMKIIVCGAAFRQSKFILEYMDTIWRNAPILRSIYRNKEDGLTRANDRWTFRMGENWAYALPIGDGQKIRGYRANLVVVDEFNSVNPEVYETVLAGFGAVSSDPIYNVQLAAARKVKQEHGVWSDEDELQYENKAGNQAIVSGTAGYDFEHFAAYYKRYRDIIKTKGEESRLRMLFPEGMPPGLSWEDFSIIRIPFELIPEGFMDAKQVARARATGSAHIYEKEYGTIFVKDSDGFFKRSLIESCVASDKNPIMLPLSGEVFFDPRTKGYPNLRYVIGIDPAYAVDNFSIVVIEIREDHRRVVYCWSTNSKDFKQRKDAGLTKQRDYYRFCAEKIRQLMKHFPLYDKTHLPVIGMDAQGGGIAVAEALTDSPSGEQPILPYIDKDKPKDTDLLPGKHILDLVQFAKFEWVSEANHGLRKDMEDKVLLFPRFDTLTLELAIQEDAALIDSGDNSRIYDSLEDCAMEIEELKDELCTIVMTKTGTGGVGGRDRWDTPEVKLDNGKKGRMRKDRYSALLIANMIARQIQRSIELADYSVVGGFTKDLAGGTKLKRNQKLYTGADWYSSIMTSDVVRAVNRRNR